MRRIILLACFIACFIAAKAQWKAYLSYYTPTEIEQARDGVLYVLASGGLYSYNPSDQQLTTYDKTTVLSDCGISHIAWCQAARRLVIVYDDYNIDLLSPNGNVVNMPAYMNTSMTVDKSVNNIDINGRNAYLSTGFGVVQINVANAEISNTYNLGFRVDYTYTDNQYIYAASSTNGLYRASLTTNLLDPNQWSRVGDYTARPKTMDPTLLATVNTLNPGGPKYNYFGFLKFYNGTLYSCNGSFSSRPGCIQTLQDNIWNIYQDTNISATTGVSYQDIYSLDVDPRNQSHIMAAARNGVYEFNNGNFTAFYNNDNSLIEPFDGTSKEYQLITGIKYDAEGNLWILNSQAPTQSIIEYTNDGQWISHKQPTLMRLNNHSLGNLKDIIIDSRGLMWFVNDNYSTPSFYAYDMSSDNINSYIEIINEDGTEYTIEAVHCISEDKDNNIWVGTTKGPFMLETSEMFSDNPILTQVKVPRNDGTDYADYLLANVDVTAMAIDKANRKWFGTGGNGIYLISSDNIAQIQHFTKENSPLLSNNIQSLALNESTGELFIGTDLGLCSYTSSIPNNGEEMTKDNVYAYPNPVRPDYQGAITITGLDENADVKIMTSNGALVNEGKAVGGQYKWYGLDSNGKRVASGIYMVAVATAEGEKGTVCKIAIVN